MTRKLSRRMLLRGASGAALALPLLNDIPRAHAQAKSADAGASAGNPLPSVGGPKRLIVMYSPNGTIPSAWMSTGSGADFNPAPIFNSLVADGHKNDLTLVHNLDISASTDGPGGDAHGLGIGCLLTGIELQAGSEFLAGCGVPGQFCGESGWPSGESFDQFIAARLPQTQRLSIDFAIKRMAASIWSRMSYTGGNGLTVEPFDDPTVAFATLFANVGASAASVAQQTSRRKSVLDEVSSELQALSASLSGQDKFKIDAHLTQVREIETQLALPISQGSSCVRPTAPTLGASAPVIANSSGMEVHTDPTVDADVPLRNTLAQQMLVAAMACDIARVGTIMMAPSRSDIFLTWIQNFLPNGMLESHHDLSHEPNSNSNAQQQLTAINQWYAQQVSQVITALKAVPENGGTMFDNTVILWCNELGIGNIHSHTNIPVLLAGSAGGYFKTGQAVTMPAGTPQNRLLLSLCEAMDVTGVTALGNPKFCTGGPIAEIKA
jgi:uncharacterized protein DUF1552